jgi:hypothetical protein
MGGGGTQQLHQLFHASWSSWLIMAVCTLAGGWLLFQVRARFRDREDPAAETCRMLMQMGELHHQGGLSDEEYRSIKRRLIEPLDDSLRGSGKKPDCEITES